MCVQQQVEDVVTPCFADHWGIICNHVSDLQTSICELELCVHLLKMEIAPDKSWVWGTTPQIRRGFRHGQRLRKKEIKKWLAKAKG